MRKSLFVSILVALLLFAVVAVAHEKVAVIPLFKKNYLDKSCLDPFTTKDNDGNWLLVCATKLVFVSSTTSTGNMGGLEGADAQCNALAGAAGLKGTFKAWLSDSVTEVASRFNWKPENVYRGTNDAIISTSLNLLDGTIDNVIDHNEKGVQIAPGFVWTNTSSNGWRTNVLTGYTCGDWQVETTINVGSVGESGSKDQKWTNFGFNGRCAVDSFRIYCFEQ